MIIERIIYLYRAIRIKIIMTYMLVFFYHVIFFIVIPLRQNKYFHDLSVVCVFYLLKVLYLVFSCITIRDGYVVLTPVTDNRYPHDISIRTLTQSDDPGTIDSILFQGYR